MAKERIFAGKLTNQGSFNNPDDRHNNYDGLKWGLLSRGKIFSKMAAHPTIMEVSCKLLGNKCRLSSLAANTVLPGMKGQQPHLDYPYYRHLWPESEDCMKLPPTHLLALQIVTLLTDFKPENGSTAIVPGSHINPQHPDNPEEFFSKAIQLTAKAGDVIMFAGPIQHCAMANNTSQIRCGILQHMVPLYITPFEDIACKIEPENEVIRQLLAVDNPHPILKYQRSNSKRGSIASGEDMEIKDIELER